ncbi:uncharacterized protein SCHCODRAFT_01097780 [Schizophyllum commune H4-8]|nr:uncharacterized protein SCHCODRAFT_01097780 [Schizophyllum commune H4-8]KAI5889857.1 hypothetical protein SCHCODRAFT_01097780 [Schizophyllum commune H4-8]
MYVIPNPFPNILKTSVRSPTSALTFISSDTHDADERKMYVVLQLACHRADRSHKPSALPRRTPRARHPLPGDAAEDCMRALRAPPPNLPTFRWTGLGRGPPRSDPGILNAGLEVWAALDAALGRSRSIKGRSPHRFKSAFQSLPPLLLPSLTSSPFSIGSCNVACSVLLFTRFALLPFFERASSIDTKRTNDFLRFSAIVLLAAVPPVPIGPSRRPPLSATVTFLLAVIVVSILLASTRTQKARRWKSVCSVTRHSRALHCASSTRSAVLRDPSTPFGQKRGTTRSSTTSRHPHFDLTRAAQDYDGEPLTTHERSRHRRRAHRSRHHLSSFPHLHVDATAGLDPRRHRPQRFRPPPPPTFRPGPFWGCHNNRPPRTAEGVLAPSRMSDAMRVIYPPSAPRIVVRFRDARGTREFPPRRLMMEGGSLRREREKGGYSCAPMDFLGDPRRWTCARAPSCKIYDGGRAEPPEARVRFLGKRCDGGGVSPTPFWGKGLVQALPTTGGGRAKCRPGVGRCRNGAGKPALSRGVMSILCPLFTGAPKGELCGEGGGPSLLLSLKESSVGFVLSFVLAPTSHGDSLLELLVLMSWSSGKGLAERGARRSVVVLFSLSDWTAVGGANALPRRVDSFDTDDVEGMDTAAHLIPFLPLGPSIGWGPSRRLDLPSLTLSAAREIGEDVRRWEEVLDKRVEVGDEGKGN